MASNTLPYNGQIITMDKNNSIAEAVIFEGDRIQYVGKTVEALRLADEDTEWKDLYGCAVLPGFIDCHIHMATSGVKIKNQIDVSKKAGVLTILDFLEKIRTVARDTPKGEWIIGSNYGHESLEEKRHIRAEELDGVAPENPVMIVHSSGHMSVVNTCALMLAAETGFDLNMEEVVKENGVPTGLLLETAHFVMLKKTPVVPDDEELISGIEKFTKSMIRRGITTAHDAGGYAQATFPTLQKAKERGTLNCRTYPMLWTLFGKEAQKSVAKTAIDGGFFSGLGDDMLKMGPIKLMVDGSAVGGTCATTKPLLNLGDVMPATFTQSELDEIFVEGHKNGFQLTAHAVGDRAIEMVLNSYEKAMTLYPRKDPRHRIEHCFLCPENLAKRIKTLGILPIPNPGFMSVWGDVFVKYYGDRLENVIPLRTFRDMGIITPFGSDALVIDEYEPLFGIAAAMERMDLKSGEVICENQKIDLLHAIRCYTYYGAYASFEENEKGSIEKGKLADLVILTDSLLGKNPCEIRNIKVQETYMGGRLV